jgi:NADH-ubiquinone oxidoreductase chain 6
MGVSAYLVLIGTAYLGLVYLIVYVGAIAILFLFVIMMMNLKIPAEEIVEFENGAEAPVERISYIGTSTLKNLPLAFVLGTLFLFEIISVLSLELTKGNLFSNNSGSIFPFLKEINDPINNLLLGSRIAEPVISAEPELYNNLVKSDALHILLNNTNYSSSINLNIEAVSLGFINSPIEENFSSFIQIQSIGQGLYTHTSI